MTPFPLPCRVAPFWSAIPSAPSGSDPPGCQEHCQQEPPGQPANVRDGRVACERYEVVFERHGLVRLGLCIAGPGEKLEELPPTRVSHDPDVVPAFLPRLSLHQRLALRRAIEDGIGSVPQPFPREAPVVVTVSFDGSRRELRRTRERAQLSEVAVEIKHVGGLAVISLRPRAEPRGQLFCSVAVHRQLCHQPEIIVDLVSGKFGLPHHPVLPSLDTRTRDVRGIRQGRLERTRPRPGAVVYMVRKSRLTGPTTRYAHGPR